MCNDEADCGECPSSIRAMVALCTNTFSFRFDHILTNSMPADLPHLNNQLFAPSLSTTIAYIGMLKHFDV